MSCKDLPFFSPADSPYPPMGQLWLRLNGNLGSVFWTSFAVSWFQCFCWICGVMLTCWVQAWTKLGGNMFLKREGGITVTISTSNADVFRNTWSDPGKHPRGWFVQWSAAFQTLLWSPFLGGWWARLVCRWRLQWWLWSYSKSQLSCPSSQMLYCPKLPFLLEKEDNNNAKEK